VAKYRSYCQSPLNRNSLSESATTFTIFELNTLISSSKSTGYIRVNVLYYSLTSRNFYHTGTTVQTSFCTTPFATNVFLVPLISWTTSALEVWRPRSLYLKTSFQPAANTGWSQHASCSPQCAPSCPNLNLQVSTTPRITSRDFRGKGRCYF
jgi:hypothetical protein